MGGTFMIDAAEFDRILTPFQEINGRYVTKRLEFYNKRVEGKRRCAHAVRWIVLILSLSIPLVASVDFTIFGMPNTFVVSLMSVLIALASGLEGIHQWQLTWKEYSGRIVQIETLIGLWEVQLVRARQLSDINEASSVLAWSTEKLLKEVNNAVSTEMESFFSTIPKLEKKPGQEQ
jgi:low affinity Fe/Cu permease